VTTTWIILADRTRASIRRRRTMQGRFEHIEDVEHREGRAHLDELLTDRAGQSTDSAHHRHAFAPHTNTHDHEAEVFAREIARRLAIARGTRRFDAVVLVAEPRFLGVLRTALDPAERRLVRGEIPKRMLDATDAELGAQLEAANLHVAG
jgi:protein required for attachment to host cells